MHPSSHVCRTYALYARFKEAVHDPSPTERNQKIGETLRALPQDRLGVLKQLVAHLRKVAAAKATNKMNEENLAIMFGPTIMRSPDGIMADLQDTGTQATMVRELLTAMEGSEGGAIDAVLRGGGNAMKAKQSMSPRKMVYPKRQDPQVIEVMETMVKVLVFGLK
jgi:hypothetical protein